MKALILGAGAAVHALVWKTVASGQVQEIYCAPGNAGTALLSGTVPLAPERQAEVVQWAFSRQVDLVVVQGLPAWTEALRGVGLPVVGVGEQDVATLASHESRRERLRKYGVPLLESRSFHQREEAERYLASRPLPVWLRSDRAPLWEAVRVETRHEAFEQLARLMSLAPGAAVSIEAEPEGPEVILALLSDGKETIPFGLSRPYDRRSDGEAGPMTEGMGAYAPFGDRALEEHLMDKVARPLLAGLSSEGLLPPAFLHLRIALDERPALRELSWGLDDLHAVVTLPRWEGNLAALLQAAAQGEVEAVPASWQPGATVAVAMVAQGYPAPCGVGYPVRGLDEANALIFHQATRLRVEETFPERGPWPSWLRPSAPHQPAGLSLPVITTAGRVLFVVGRGLTGAEARHQAYEAVERLSFPHRSWRRDIAAEL